MPEIHQLKAEFTKLLLAGQQSDHLYSGRHFLPDCHPLGLNHAGRHLSL